MSSNNGIELLLEPIGIQNNIFGLKGKYADHNATTTSLLSLDISGYFGIFILNTYIVTEHYINSLSEFIFILDNLKLSVFLSDPNLGLWRTAHCPASAYFLKPTIRLKRNFFCFLQLMY